jgi:Flp pilus assembly protein TadG
MSGTAYQSGFHKSVKSRASLRKHQSGNAAIEFALIFVIAFVVFYATVTYSLTFLLKQGFTQAAQEGVRSAIKVDPTTFSSTSNYESTVESTAQSTATQALSWLPASAVPKVSYSAIYTPGTVPGTGVLTLTVSYLNYKTAGLLPVLSFPGVGAVPNVPTDLVGTAKLML